MATKLRARKSVEPALEAKIVKLYREDGLTQKRIAARLNVGVATVIAVLHRNAVPIDHGVRYL